MDYPKAWAYAGRDVESLQKQADEAGLLGSLHVNCWNNLENGGLCACIICLDCLIPEAEADTNVTGLNALC